MPTEDDSYMNGVGRTQSVYQQPSTGEKHVLFYPTSPAPSANSDERRSWSQASSSFVNAHGTVIKATSNCSNSGQIQDKNNRMKKNENSASDPPDAGGSSSSQNQPQQHYSTSSYDSNRYNFKIGIYGWRKRCLYVLILGLLVMVIVNLALTLWVLKVMEFSSEGMGQLKIVTGGLRLEGTAYVLDSLITSRIRSRTGQSILVESSRNLTLTTRDERGNLDNILYLGNDRFECLANNFKVMDDRGHLVFSANQQEVILGSEWLRITGEGGTIVRGSVQTPLVRAESGHDLRLESPTRTLEMRAPSGINIESRAGDIKSVSLNDIKLRSVEGAIKLDSGAILMEKIPTAIPSSKVAPSKNHDIYQLCICNSGKLFLVPPRHLCSDDGVLCR